MELIKRLDLQFPVQSLSRYRKPHQKYPFQFELLNQAVVLIYITFSLTIIRFYNNKTLAYLGF